MIVNRYLYVNYFTYYISSTYTYYFRLSYLIFQFLNSSSWPKVWLIKINVDGIDFWAL